MAVVVVSFKADGTLSFTQRSEKDYGSPTWTVNKSPSVELTHGTAAENMDLAYAWESTIAGGASLTVDLTGSLTGEFGQAVNFARVKVIYFKLKTDTVPAGGVLVGAAAVNSVVTWQVPVKNTALTAGDFRLLLPDAVGIVVTAGTNDQFRVVNQDATIAATYEMFIGGCSA